MLRCEYDSSESFWRSFASVRHRQIRWDKIGDTLASIVIVSKINLLVPFSTFRWYVDLNYMCKELGLGLADRNSVPPHLKTKDQIRAFLLELRSGFEEWRAMKMVVLGHGRIGKTTLLTAIKSLLQQLSKVFQMFTHHKILPSIQESGRDCQHSGCWVWPDKTCKRRANRVGFCRTTSIHSHSSVFSVCGGMDPLSIVSY